MSPFVKTILILVAVLCCLQLVHMARLPQKTSSGTGGKSSDDLDVKALSNLILNRLKDNIKDGSDSVKNIVNSASDTLQRNGGMRAGVAALL